MTEHDIQSTFFSFCEWRAQKDPRWGCIFAIPNGGKRHIFTARKMKKEGVKAGVPDVFVAVPSGTKHGLFIEFKAKGNKPTAKQVEWREKLTRRGYHVDVCYSADEAIELVEDYLGAV